MTRCKPQGLQRIQAVRLKKQILFFNICFLFLEKFTFNFKTKLGSSSNSVYISNSQQ